MIFHLISLSEIKSLCASVSSSEAGERLKDVSRRAAELTERAKRFSGLPPKNQEILFCQTPFSLISLSEIQTLTLRLCDPRAKRARD